MAAEKTEKIKVLVIAPSTRLLGGQSIQARRLLEAFEADEQIEMVFLPNDPESLFKNTKFFRTIFTSLKFWWSLLKNTGKFDVLHIFSSGTTSYIISTLPPLLAAKLFGKKSILHYHTGEAELHLKNWKLTAKPTMRKFDKIIVPSRFLVEVFAGFGLRAGAIFNFVETGKFVFRQRETLKPVFLSNRNFEKHYDVGSTLRAFQLIQQKIPEARLLLAGSGSEENKLIKLAEELELKNVQFIGRIEQDEMPEIYDRADIYLNSSVVDNMPLSLIEAFACGLPVVSSKAGGIPFICENGATALLVEKEDFQALAHEALRLLENPDLAQKIIAGARREIEKYDKHRLCGEWAKVYRFEEN